MNKCKNNNWVFISHLAVIFVSSSYVLMDIMLCNAIMVSYKNVIKKEETNVGILNNYSNQNHF